MEVDFNTTNKIIYGQQMLHQATQYKLIPEGIYSKRNWLVDDGTLAKVLFYNIVCQTRHPAGISVVNADNCYDRIAHPIALLVFQACGVPQRRRVSQCTLWFRIWKIIYRQVLGSLRWTQNQPKGRKHKGVREMEWYRQVRPALSL